MCKKKNFGSKGIHYQSKGNIIFGIFVVGIIIITLVGVVIIYKGFFRLDQYATTILGTTAGIIGTMFGLTAASYAFIWGDLRSDSQENRHLGKVLECYSKKLWHLFVCSLILTVSVILTSLIGLTLAQIITNPSLFKTRHVDMGLISEYKNDKFYVISVGALLNLTLSAIDVIAMAWMNWVVFRRNEQYATIAESILIWIQGKYDMKLLGGNSKNHNSTEYEKIHNLEILVERVLKNHESIGNAFAESHRREKLLTAIITNELKSTYNVDSETYDMGSNITEKGKWKHLEEKKRESRFDQCREKAVQEYKLLAKKNTQVREQENLPPKPCDCSFITVYDDLLLYRDNSLVWEEKHKIKWRVQKKQSEQQEFADMFKRRALRFTIKKRLLIFYLRGETFSNMDLTGVSFSGADLRFTNFSGCNLTGIRLKGSNCEGADFTKSKMTGMYFDDVTANGEDEVGEIQLSCIDIPLESDTKKEWDPYNAREITNLRDATFKDADVSRAYLKALGDLDGEQKFPFGTPEANVWKLGAKKSVFSLVGTNFDYAKMFFSYFKNIDLTNSSLIKAQMYNVGMVQTKAKSANFTAVTLTNACCAWCDFENADFSDASMAETILVRINFRGANMRNVNFSYSNIISCNFEGASCQNASFKNIIQDLEVLKRQKPEAFKEIKLNKSAGLKFSYATLTNTDFSGAKLDNVSFSNAIGANCIFTKSTGRKVKYDNAIFISSVFNTVRFEGVILKNTILRNSIFTDSQFKNSIFVKMDFSETLFTGLSEPCFVGGRMIDVNFSNARGLTAACFSKIFLKQVDFRGTGIQEINFNNDVTIIECTF